MVSQVRVLITQTNWRCTVKAGDKVKIKRYTDKSNPQPNARIAEVDDVWVKVRLDGIGGLFVFKVDDVEVISESG